MQRGERAAFIIVYLPPASMVIRIRFAMLTAGNYGMIATGNHGDFGFAARRTVPGEGFRGLRYGVSGWG